MLFVTFAVPIKDSNMIYKFIFKIRAARGGTVSNPFDFFPYGIFCLAHFWSAPFKFSLLCQTKIHHP